jgi:hypothetical protein
LNLLKAFQNQRDCHWPAFKSGWCNAAIFLKENSLSPIYLSDFKIVKLAPCRFSKVLNPTLRHLLSNRNKGFELAGLKSFQQIQKLFALNES